MIGELLQRRKDSNKVGIICGDTKLSYKKWHEMSTSLSDNMLKNYQGKIVGLFLPNGVSYAVSYFACLYANKCIAPFHVGSSMDELLYTITHCNISIIITTERYSASIEKLVDTHSVSLTIIVINDDTEVIHISTFGDLRNKETENDGILDDVAILLHTSGTTSRPKRVMLTHEGLLSNVKSHCTSLGFGEDEVCLIQLPMVFGYCNTAQFLAHVYLGACIVINPNPFMISDFYRIVEKWRITNFTAVPSILNLLYESNISTHDITSLRVICFGGNPISATRIGDLIKKFPSVCFIQTYGLTEAGPRATAVSCEHYDEQIGSVGRAIPGVEIAIVDSNGTRLPANMVGEVIIKSKGIMKGYYNCVEETKAIIRNGWLYTGDLGYLQADGLLYIVGRKKNIIITGGINVSPEEVEEVIKLCPNVLEAKVYGVKDNLLGEIIKADIVTNSSDSDILQHIRSICQEKLSVYKIPKEFQIVNAVNKTYNGKIKRSIKGERNYDIWKCE